MQSVPKICKKFLEFIIKEELLEEVIGDLEEAYFENLKSKSSWLAKVYFFYETLNYIRPFALKTNFFTNIFPFFMLRHNLLLTFRNFQRDKATFLINLIGLSTGLACALLIFLWVFDELSIDKFHENDAQLYQVMKHSTKSDGTISTYKWTPAPLAKAMKEEMPEVRYATSLILEPTDQKGVVKIGDRRLRFTEQYAEPDFFKMFSYKFLAGNPANMLQRKEEIVISEQFAKKVFNTTQDLIGKTIEWEKGDFSGVYQIAGIYEMPPSNASMQFDLVFHFDLVIDNYPEINQWTYGGPDTYIALKEGADAHALNQKLSTYLQEKSKEDYQTLFMRPYSDKYLYNKYENGKLAGGRIEYVRLFSIIALFILAIACINFMNLSTAKATQRSKEVGVKKTLGADRKDLISQYLSESVLLAFVSLTIATVAVHFILPTFNNITSKILVLELSPTLILVLLGGTLMTGLIAGSYPAFYLSGFRPVEVLKGKINRSLGEAWLRKGLVVFQFAISVILIISVLVIYKQIEFVQNKNLGFTKDQVIQFKKEGKLNVQLPVFLTKINALPNVLNAGAIRGNLIHNQTSTTGVRWQGFEEGDQVSFSYLNVDYNLLETIGAEMLEGRTFSKDYGNERSKIIFNETAIKAMGLENPVGKIVRQWGKDKEIIGVVKDFHFESLYEKVKPCFIMMEDEATDVFVKIKKGTEKETIAAIAATFKEMSDGLTLDYHFLDAEYEALYAAEQQMSSLSKYFAGIAILISCLGLFGLVTFSAQRRVKEIGIRKVLGASILNIIQLLSIDFTKMILLGIFIALPVSYWLMDNWLGRFAFKIELHPAFFFIAGLGALLIAWLTMSIQTIKAANRNPTESLKAE